jgi:hypothetical protein
MRFGHKGEDAVATSVEVEATAAGVRWKLDVPFKLKRHVRTYA